MAKQAKQAKRQSSTSRAKRPIVRQPMKQHAAPNRKKAGKSAPVAFPESAQWPASHERIVQSLDTPDKIQAYLDSIPYDPSDNCRSVWQALSDGKAHCFGACMIAAYCLQRHGCCDGMPAVVELDADPELDDGHMLTIYKKRGLWGVAAKSNYNGLRGRDPVYTSLRELVMSYFEFYVNEDGLKTLRAYSDPLYLDKLDPGREWVTRHDIDSGAKKVEKCLKCRRACV